MSNSNPRVIIADDESHIRMMMKSMFKRLDWEVVSEAKNGQEAIDLYKQLKPDILLLDVNMPHKTGFDVLEEIFEFDANACIIMLTSVTDCESTEKCIDNGAANYILKTNSIKDIKNLIIQTWEELHNNI